MSTDKVETPQIQPVQFITRDEILMGRDKEFPLSHELEANLAVLLARINQFRSIVGTPMKVSSGYRPGRYNTAAGGASKSSHLSCEAVDFIDTNNSLKRYIANNPGILDTCDLYMEDPARTPTWVHLQTRKTNARIFKP